MRLSSDKLTVYHEGQHRQRLIIHGNLKYLDEDECADCDVGGEAEEVGVDGHAVRVHGRRRQVEVLARHRANLQIFRIFKLFLCKIRKQFSLHVFRQIVLKLKLW